MTRPRLGAIAVLLWAIAPGRLAAQETSPPAAAPAARPWNELETKAIALQLHVTLLEDGAFFSQNAASVSQVGDLPSTGEFRVDRLQLSGQLKAPFPWSFEVNAGYNGLDANSGDVNWTIADLWISVPLGTAANVTVGEQEAGVGLERQSHGEDLPFMERSTMSEAYKKSHELGVRFWGTAAGERMTWSAGWFNNWLTDHESFDESGNAYAGRVTGLAVDEDEGRSLVHLGVSAAYTQIQEGSLQARSRPEVHQAPYFVDTGSFAGDHSLDLGFELAAAKGPVSLVAEYTHSDVSAPASGNPTFSGWYVTAAWVLTGETRPYERANGYFGRVTPDAPLSFAHGGFGAVELAARYSWIDLTSQAIPGGKFDRWSGALSWYPTTWSRFEFDYGYGRLQRDGTTGLSRFYQLRLQLEF
ncbi:MAG TPA: porin [Thermoanaerobaculia bacterium]|nr:porin [Thermoanaerobaculia bacterium]